MNIEIGFQMFRLRQLTGIPFTRLAEVAAEIAFNTLINDPDLISKTIKTHSTRDPMRQIEIDINKGYKRVT